MNLLRKLAFLPFIFLLPFSASASDEFHTSFTVSYHFDQNGKSRVKQQITLTNRLSQIYATSYNLRLRGETPQGITGRDSKGPLKITTVQEPDNSTLVIVEFNEPAAGRGQSLTFTLTYEGNPATKNGQIWEIILPKLTSDNFADQYDLHLQVPRSFGRPAFISPPAQASDETQPEYYHYHFTKSQVASSGVVAAFGNFQVLDYNLVYQLENPESKAKSLTIAIPPDTAYQRVFYSSLDPQPKNVTTDPDGNWLAEYHLQPHSALTVTAAGQVHLLSSPVTTPHEHPTRPPEAYLGPSKYWQTNDPQLVAIAKTLTTPKSIYDYVVNTLSYDYSRVTSNPARLGASAALSRPSQALCAEFTDLFITLARISGIPAREINGFAFTTDPVLKTLSLTTDILHAWPEYYDSNLKIWRSVDPTLAKTSGGVDYFNKLDLSHFAFVIHGTSPEFPLPAGLYKKSPNAKNVDVRVGEYREHRSLPLQISWKGPFQFLPLMKNVSFLEIKNLNGTAMYHQQVALSSQTLSLSDLNSKPAPISIIPPYASVSMTIYHNPSYLPHLGPKYLHVSAGNQSVTYNVPESKFILWYVSIAVAIAAGLILMAFFAHQAWDIYIQRQKGPNPLRGQGQKPA